MRQALVIIEFASDSLLAQHEIQHHAVVPETVLLRDHDVAGREAREVVCEQREMRWVAGAGFPKTCGESKWNGSECNV
jgi:hypothetical protein